jgi:hypothetical protein
MFNVCFEAIASAWIYSKQRVVKEPVEHEVYAAQDHMIQTKHSMEMKEKELVDIIYRLAKEALAKKKIGDMYAAKQKINERARNLKSLQRLRNGIAILSTRLDELKASELDKEIVNSLKASCDALKRAGVGVNIEDVERVMDDFDEQMHNAQNITAILEAPVTATIDDNDAELQAELDRLLHQEENNLLQDDTILLPMRSDVQLDANKTVDSMYADVDDHRNAPETEASISTAQQRPLLQQA